MDTIHKQVSASRVLCGLHMRDDSHPRGWDLGTASVDWSRVTCDDCHRVSQQHPKEGEVTG